MRRFPIEGAYPSIAGTDPAGRVWLQTLPSRVAALAAAWDLQPDGTTAWRGSHAVVLPVRRANARCVLKLAWPTAPAAAEAEALRTWGGDGAAHLLAARPDVGALLLERLDATRTLAGVPLAEAAPIAGGLLRRLSVPAPTGTPPLRARAEAVAAGLAFRQARLGHPVPRAWAEQARTFAQELGGRAGNRLSHGDLHYGNILAGTRAPWQAIDPQPVAGDPEYGVPELLWTRVDEVADDAGIRQLLTTVVAAGGLDAALARGWAIVRCVDYWLWGLEHGLTEDPQRCRRVLAALV